MWLPNPPRRSPRSRCGRRRHCGCSSAEAPQPAPPAADAETNSISSEPDTAIASGETAGTETLSTAETAAPTAEAAPATSAPASDESAESETTETMDQLLDQFSTPPAASEGEIFDGRVLAVTDAGVVVDVGGKFEGLVPAQEFLDSGEPIEFGEGQTIEVERLHERKDGYVLLSLRARAPAPRLGAHREIVPRAHERHRQDRRANQGRAGGEYRRARVFAGLADRAAAGARPGSVEGPRDRSARPEAEPQARQRGGQPARDPGRRAESQARRAGGNACPKARWSPGA